MCLCACVLCRRGKATHCPLPASPRTLQLCCDDPGGCMGRARSSSRWSPRTLQLCCDDLGGFPLLPAGGCAAGVRYCRHASVSPASRLSFFRLSFPPPVSFVRSFVRRRQVRESTLKSLLTAAPHVPQVGDAGRTTACKKKCVYLYSMKIYLDVLGEIKGLLIRGDLLIHI